MGILIVLLILILVFGSGGLYVGRADYAGPGAGLHTLLYAACVVIVVIVVLRLLGVLV